MLDDNFISLVVKQEDGPSEAGQNQEWESCSGRNQVIRYGV